jgi:PAS domain S-box-containing protein
MEIDIRTLSVIVALAYIIEASALSFLYVHNKKYSGIAWWVLGSAVGAAGYLFLLLRDITTNLLITIILPNILIVSGSLMVYVGILRFLNEKENPGLVVSILALFTAAYTYFTYISSDISVRTAIISVFLGFISLAMARELYGKKTRGTGGSANFLAAILFLQGSFLLVRAVIVLTIVPVDSLFAPTSVQTATALIFFVFGILFTIGLIILVNQRLNAEVTEAKEDFELIFHLSPAGVLITCLDDGRIVDANEGFLSLTGFSRGELVGSSAMEDRLWKKPGDRHIAAEELKKTGFIEDFETVFHRKDTGGITCLLSARIISLRETPHIIWVVTDITGRKRAEAERESLIAELARKNAELDRFTYTVSHDLKSPLLAIRGFLSLLEGDIQAGNTEQSARYIQRISASVEKLETLITTLLALSRSGRSVDQPEQIPFADLVREAARILDPTLIQRGVTLVIQEDLPVVQGDRQRLLQVMINLFDNAVKFMGDQPEPRLEVGVRDEAGSKEFFVRDNGMGIRQENLARVFGLFERFNPEVPGTGIGLSTVMRIIEAHGGQIWAESEGEGKGTTFFFTLPAAGNPVTTGSNR